MALGCGERSTTTPGGVVDVVPRRPPRRAASPQLRWPNTFRTRTSCRRNRPGRFPRLRVGWARPAPPEMAKRTTSNPPIRRIPAPLTLSIRSPSGPGPFWSRPFRLVGRPENGIEGEAEEAFYLPGFLPGQPEAWRFRRTSPPREVTAYYLHNSSVPPAWVATSAGRRWRGEASSPRGGSQGLAQGLEAVNNGRGHGAETNRDHGESPAPNGSGGSHQAEQELPLDDRMKRRGSRSR